eukprot:gene47187-63212_t
MQRRHLIQAAGALPLATLAARTAFAFDGPELYAGEKALYAEAQKEGLCVSFDTGPEWANWKSLFRDFKKRYPEIELTYNWGTESYELGTAYGHIALGVPDAYAACEKIKAAGGNVTREPGPVKGGTTVIAFVTDPDGYKIELIQRPQRAQLAVDVCMAQVAAPDGDVVAVVR